MTKLTSKDVVEIRRALAQGVTNRKLSKLYGVSETTISQIKGRTRHLSAELKHLQQTRAASLMGIWLTVEEADALLGHLDACQYWLTNRTLEDENEELAMMLERRIKGT